MLLIEDSRRIRTTVAKALSRLGHAVDEAADGEEGEEFATVNEYDVVVLDLMLPGQHGLMLLEKWRKAGNDTPVLLLTAMDGIEDRVRGLEMGADDYLVKPFAIAELAARLEVLVRRKFGRAESVVKIGPLEVNFVAKQVMRDGESIVLTAREFALFECLAKRPGQVLSREQIEAQLYSESDSPLSNAVDAAVYALRRKLSPNGAANLIHTRRGLGYVLEP
ncbi:response regulator transcription factor [Phragmitibacter flavus]|uniref:response regulator transcription factor n=1 Tax=Phragmitibacter flavus TaxID=2576071 RepID=UPI0023F36099|nr:response regulator transcription factor [Phragmitibacter flavus]